MKTQYMGVDVCINLAVLLFKIVTRYFYTDLKFVGTVGTGGPVKFFLAV